MKQKKHDTMTSQEMAYFFANLENKPVYAYCAYNNYKLMKIMDIGHCYVLVSPEEEGCWMPSSSIKDSEYKPEPITIKEDDDEPTIA